MTDTDLDLLAMQRERIRELEAALQPFASAARRLREFSPGTPLLLPMYIETEDDSSGVRVGDLFKAAEVCQR